MKAYLTLSFSHLGHRRPTKKKTRKLINSLKRTKTYPRSKMPEAENPAPFHLVQDTKVQRRMTESMAVGFSPLLISDLESVT